MNYPEELRERYNEVMYDERDIIEKFLKDQYDIRYGRQRDTWHFEPAIEMLSSYGNTEHVTDIMLDKDRFVIFILDDAREYECFDFAYGELSKIIEALPDADEIVRKNAINDISEQIKNLRIDLLLEESPFNYEVGGNVYNVYNYKVSGDEIRLLSNDGRVLIPDGVPLEMFTAFRDHINIEVLHKYDEYRKLVKFLSEQPNLCFEPADWGHVMFTIHGTDVKVDVLSASLDSNDKLQLCVDDDGQETIYFEEKDIRPEYLVDLVGYIEDHCRCDIMDTYNGHNAELVRKINAAWKKEVYHKLFGTILLALLYRDNMEYEQKFGEILDYSEEYAMEHAHEIMEGVCDDQDLETILSFIRYKE